MNEEKKYHLINQYLNGELQGRNLDNFKASMKDPSFQKEVELQRQIIAAIEDERKAELKAYITENSKVTYFQNSWGNKWNYASAAIVVLFVSAFFIMKFYNPEPKSEEIVTTNVPTDSGLAVIDSSTTIDSQAVAIQEIVIPINEDQNSNMNREQTEELADPEDSPELEVFTLEGDAEFDKALDEADILSKKPASRTDADAEILVKKDQLIATKVYTVNMFSPDFGTGRGKTEGSSVDNDSLSAESKDAEETATNKYRVLNSKPLSVEFWKSPINFKGYQYAGGALKLYDIDQNASLTFKELDGRLYMKLGAKYYYLEKNAAYNKFVEVKNSTLLKALNG